VHLFLFKFIFWFFICLIFYVYFGYPALLYLFARKSKKHGVPVFALPRISLLISAYNERSVIGRKLENSLALQYPKELLDIIVISDCSDDGTDEVVLGFAHRGVRLVRLAQRLGKSLGINEAVPQAHGDFLVFSDANALYQPDALLRLISCFADPHVGYVVGNARYVEPQGQPSSAESEGLYWKLETWLKKKESDLGSVVGGDGAIYAIRRELFTPLLPTDINDFLNPLQIIVRGYRGVYEPQAICHEEAGDSFEKEFRRKVRIVSRSLNAIFRAPAVLLPWNQPRHWFALVSHKLLRWFVPVFLILSLFAALCLWSSPFYRMAFLLQLAFYALAVAGWALEKRGSAPKVLYLPYYFCLVNLASLVGIFKLSSGSLSSTWQTVRHDPTPPQDPTASFAKRGS